MGSIFNSSSNSSNSLKDSSRSISNSLKDSSGNFIKGKSNFKSGECFNYMGDFSTKIYQIDSQEIKNKHSQNCNQSWENYILEKINELKESKDYAEDLANQYNISLEELAYMLGDEELYKKYCLRPFYDPLKLIESFNKELKEIYEDSKELTEDEIKEHINNLNKRKKEFQNTKIKFILTDIGINQGITGRVLTNACNLLNKRFPYGALHAGLMIDETIIQWGKGPLGPGIIFPSSDLRNILFTIEVESSKKKDKLKQFFKVLGIIGGAAAIGIPLTIFGGPLGPLFGGIIISGGILGGLSYGISLSWEIKKINEDEVNKIARKCVLYNRRKKYHYIDNNCQKFVDDILEAIDAPFNPSGELRNVIDKISKNGYSPFIYQGNEFKSRREFDNYVKNINFKDLCPDDKKLLLCYKSLYDNRLKIIQKEENRRQLTEKEIEEYEKYKTDDENFWEELLSKEN